MAKTYEVAKGEVSDLIATALEKWHQELKQEGVTVHALFVSDEDADGDPVPALKRNGLPVAAQIKITSLADRARGVPDAKLEIDHLAWSRLPNGSKLALIDHELQHVALQRSPKTGLPLGDDLNRPKLKLKPHDWELQGFASVTERHGEASLESRQIAHFRAEFAQLSLFPE